MDLYACDIHAPECFETLPKSAEYDNGLNDTEYLLPPVLPKETNNAGGCAPPLENVEFDKDRSLDQDLSLYWSWEEIDEYLEKYSGVLETAELFVEERPTTVHKYLPFFQVHAGVGRVLGIQLAVVNV